MILAALIRIYEITHYCRPGYIGGGMGQPLTTGKCWSRCCSMRLASPSTKVEFEHCYFTNTRFYIRDPDRLREFLGGLSIYQQSLLRYLELDIVISMWKKRSVTDWMACFALLPPNLKYIRFQIWNCPSDVRKIGEEWFMCYSRSDWPVENYGPILNLLGKMARRYAAKAKIGLCGGSSRRGSEDIEWFRVLDELEPWSDDWIEWWEEDRKFDIAGIEPAK